MHICVCMLYSLHKNRDSRLCWLQDLLTDKIVLWSVSHNHMSLYSLPTYPRLSNLLLHPVHWWCWRFLYLRLKMNRDQISEKKTLWPYVRHPFTPQNCQQAENKINDIMMPIGLCSWDIAGHNSCFSEEKTRSICDLFSLGVVSFFSRRTQLFTSNSILSSTWTGFA